MKKLRYVERYWSEATISRAKFRAAAICRWLRKGDPDPEVDARLRRCALRARLHAKTLPKRKDSR